MKEEIRVKIKKSASEEQFPSPKQLDDLLESGNKNGDDRDKAIIIHPKSQDKSLSKRSSADKLDVKKLGNSPSDGMQVVVKSTFFGRLSG